MSRSPFWAPSTGSGPPPQTKETVSEVVPRTEPSPAPERAVTLPEPQPEKNEKPEEKVEEQTTLEQVSRQALAAPVTTAPPASEARPADTAAAPAPGLSALAARAQARPAMLTAKMLSTVGESPPAGLSITVLDVCCGPSPSLPRPPRRLACGLARRGRWRADRGRSHLDHRPGERTPRARRSVGSMPAQLACLRQMSAVQGACFLRLNFAADFLGLGATLIGIAGVACTCVTTELPSPTTTKGAQRAGCTSFAPPLSIIASMDRRIASARSTDLSDDMTLRAAQKNGALA